MQFNSILFPGPVQEVSTNMENIVFIPRGKLREPQQQEETKQISQEESKGPGYKDQKMSSSWSCGLSRSQQTNIAQRPGTAQASSSSAYDNLEQDVKEMPKLIKKSSSAEELPKPEKKQWKFTEHKTRQVADKESHFIPCIFVKAHSSKLMLYFHGNAEDLAIAEQQVSLISRHCNINVLGMEYPGYGLYTGNGDASAAKIQQDAEYVYKYVLQECGLQEEDIIVFGRSMGSGPASFLAGNYNPAALCLMSAYTSVKAVAGDVVGWLSFLVQQRFNNLEMVKKATCPTFILHGRQDEVIPFHHGKTLSEQSRGIPVVFEDRGQMTHNDYRMNQDLLWPLRGFIQKVGILVEPNERIQNIMFSSDISQPPEVTEQQSSKKKSKS